MSKHKLRTTRWTCAMRDGGEVYRFDRAGKPRRRPVKGALKLGEELCVPTLIGYCRATVTKCGDGTAEAESGGIVCMLRFGEDDRGCWTSSIAFEKRALGRLSTVL